MKDQIKEAAKLHAYSVAPNPSKYDAPFYTTLDRHNDAEDSFIAGAEYALSEKEEIKAYKKQISELQSKLMTERRSNAKITKRAEKEEEWIPVSERLPEPEVVVLVYVKDINAVRTDKIRITDSYGLEINSFRYESVTHWRKLPSPPKSR